MNLTPKRNSKPSASLLPMVTLLASLLLCLISMTGCGKHYIIKPGSDTVTITKEELDRLYSDNEACLKALEGR
jgi:hypothetical protein